MLPLKGEKDNILNLRQFICLIKSEVFCARHCARLVRGTLAARHAQARLFFRLSAKEFSRHFPSKEPRCTTQELYVRSEGEEVWGIKALLVFFLFITEVLGSVRAPQTGTARKQLRRCKPRVEHKQTRPLREFGAFPFHVTMCLDSYATRELGIKERNAQKKGMLWIWFSGALT